MEDPIKIIHKFKNNSKKIQYHVHVFIGSLVKRDVVDVLEKIKNIDLYDAFVKLDQKERDVIERMYGEFWYDKFYNMHHIVFTKTTIMSNNVKINEIKTIYGEAWYSMHITDYKKRIQTTEYSYESVVKEERERRYVKKHLRKKDDDVEEDMDYSTMDATVLNRVVDVDDYVQRCDADFQDGGNDDSDVDDFFSSLNEPDQEVKKTTQEIKSIISNSKFSKMVKGISDFDTSKDNSMFDENIKNVFKKNYITTQYIFKEDTIKNIKWKICCAFKNSSRYGDPVYIVPQYQYLWSEYIFRDKVEKVMIGQKWVVRNDILKLDVEPNAAISAYEELRGTLASLKDSIRRQGRVKREDEENFILDDYDGFYACNEIYMLDIYNELGRNYDPSFDDLKNIIDVYFKIYFPHIAPENIPNIINFLKQSAPDEMKVVEKNSLKAHHDQINNDLIMENEITTMIENTKKDIHKIPGLFSNNYVIQSVVFTYLVGRGKKVDLWRIFDNFVIDDDYVFVQHRPINGVANIRSNKKFLMEYEDKNIIAKWFDNSPYGISIKAKMMVGSRTSYIAINLNENGRMDYKVHWKESDMLTVTDIKRTFPYIVKLIQKINIENHGFIEPLRIPDDDAFRYAFINTIQKFNLPGKFTIDHNDLSDFARYFYPYVALVIEPGKKQSRKDSHKGSSDVVRNKGKYGTYLRYKRVSKYDSVTKIENRIVFFMRNHEYSDQILASQISKEFNITEEEALKHIVNVEEQNPGMKKSRKVLKKMEDISKIKLPGIGIDIQGRERDKYKIRVDGARDINQLNRIMAFMNTLIYLYVEVYLYEKPERQRIKETLKGLTKIASRKNKVEKLIRHEASTKPVKQTIALDKERLGSKASIKQNQWARDCQQSGDDKMRQPTGYVSEDELKRKGYVWVEKLDGIDFGHYERRVMIDEDGKTTSNKKKTEVILKAVKLPKMDSTGSDDQYVYWTCGPEKNGKHVHIGFLGKTSYPKPCCFIKDHMYSANDNKRNAFLRSMGVLNSTGSVEKRPTIEQLYILNENNKMSEGRLAVLPKYLNVLFNHMLNHTRTMKSRYLTSTDKFCFKYGTNQDTFRYLRAISFAIKMSIDEMKDKMVKALMNDKSMSLFTSLNNGDIRAQFGTVDKYIAFIKDNENLSHDHLNDIICTPGVIVDSTGMNVVVFQKKITTVQKTLEKDKIKETYDVVCGNSENIEDLQDPQRKTVILIMDDGYYYPVVSVTKKLEAKHLEMQPLFDRSDKVMDHVYEYYKLNCRSDFKVLTNNDMDITARQICGILRKHKLTPKYQLIDGRYKCQCIVTSSNNVIPSAHSGSVYDLEIINNIDRFVVGWDETFGYLSDLNKKTNGELKVKPIGAYYHARKEKDYVVSSIMTESLGSVPVKEIIMSKTFIKDNKLHIQNKPLDSDLDKEIMKGSDKGTEFRGEPTNVVVDNRVMGVSKSKYIAELYQLFRLHVSYYLNNTEEGLGYKERLGTLVDSQIGSNDRFFKIKAMVYEMTDRTLSTTFQKVMNVPSISKKVPEWFSISPTTTKIDYPSIKINNIREVCDMRNKDTCEKSSFCKMRNNSCVLEIRDDYLVEFINRLTNELYQGGTNAYEVLKRDNYFVSNVVDRNVFAEREGETILSGNNLRIDKIMAEIFGENSIPKIGKQRNVYGAKKGYVKQTDDSNQMNIDHPLKKHGPWAFQEIVNNNISLYRAFANCYYWSLHPHNNDTYRNIGYYSDIQTSLANYYRSQVVDWILNKKNHAIVEKYIKAGKITEFAVKISRDVATFTDCVVELIALSKIYDVCISVYDDNDDIAYSVSPEEGLTKDASKGSAVNMRFSFITNKVIPDNIEAMYRIGSHESE